MKIFTLLALIFLFFTPVSAQIDTNSVWTWVKGDSSINQSGVYGTKGIISPTNKPGARRGSLTWMDNQDNLWMYGGSGYAGGIYGSLNDLWKYSKSENSWVWVSGSDSSINTRPIYGSIGVAGTNNNPGGLGAKVTWKGPNNTLWMLGSATTLWKYDIDTNTWTWVNGDTATTASTLTGQYGTKGVASSANRPGSRSNSVSWADKQGNLWMFGGSGYGNSASGYLNDLWKYNIQTNKWTWMNGDSTIDLRSIFGTKGIAAATNTPGGRMQSVGWTDTAGNFWLFGGFGRAVYTVNNSIVNFYMNDLWKFETYTNRWIWVNGDTTTGFNQFSIYGIRGIESPSNKPGLRGDASGTADAYGNLYLYNGWGSSINSAVVYLSDFWKYNIATNQWIWLKGDNTGYQPGNYGNLGIAATSNKPGNRWDTNTWIDTLGNVWLFGGEGSADVNGSSTVRRNDLWCLANVYATRASGNWNDPGTWANNVVPPPGQKVIIYNQVRVNVNATVYSLQVRPGGSVQVQPGINLTTLR